MDTEKMHELLDDVTGEGASNCCGAAVYELGDNFICQDCKEWCDLDKEEEVPDRVFSNVQLTEIAALEKQCAEAGCDDNGHKHE